MAAAAGLGIGGAALAAAKEEPLASVTHIGAMEHPGAPSVEPVESSQGGQAETPAPRAPATLTN